MSNADPSVNPNDDAAPAVRLCDADAAVLDAVLAGGAVDGSDPRVKRVLGLLALLDVDRAQTAGGVGPDPRSPVPDPLDEDAVAATLARVAAARRGSSPPAPLPITPLCEADAEALDVVLEHRRRGVSPGAGPVPAASRARVERVAAVLNLLDGAGAPGGAERDDDADEALVARTVQAAADARQRERFAQQVQMFADPPRTIGVGWRQLLTAAAVFLLGVSLLMPVLDRTRAEGQRAACAANLATAGMGFNAYAADHDGALPRGPARPGDPWTLVGQPSAVSPEGYYQSNSAHLYLLIRLGYVSPDELACASNDAAGAASTSPVALGRLDWSSPAAVSYSYQNQYTPRPIRVDLTPGSFAVLADKNPRFVPVSGRLAFDPGTAPDAPTRLHRGEGQNVLHLDGHVRFTAQARNGDDGLWTLQGHPRLYQGDEHPAVAGTDSFLVP